MLLEWCKKKFNRFSTVLTFSTGQLNFILILENTSFGYRAFLDLIVIGNCEKEEFEDSKSEIFETVCLCLPACLSISPTLRLPVSLSLLKVGNDERPIQMWRNHIQTRLSFFLKVLKKIWLSTEKWNFISNANRSILKLVF